MRAERRDNAAARATLSFDALRAHAPTSTAKTWLEKDVVCYALAAGFGRDELDRSELPFLFEGNGLLVVPTFATMLAGPESLDDCGWNSDHVVIAARHLEVFSPLLPRDAVEISMEVVDAWPNVDDAGCFITTRCEARRDRDKRALFALTSTWLARADRIDGSPRDARALPAVVRPERDPDFTVLASAEFSHSVLYRWIAAGPAWQVDTDAARRAGFDRPTVSPDCTMGHVCKAILATVCDYDPTLLRGLSVRFASPVYADDDLRVRMWQDGPVIAFDAVVESRIVFDGRCELAT
ncbi:MAG: MaoC/PaaZ C-terminal domain-containing protein [Pseudomonadota bacterium]